jgi:hypothetical protein
VYTARHQHFSKIGHDHSRERKLVAHNLLLRHNCVQHPNLPESFRKRERAHLRHWSKWDLFTSWRTMSVYAMLTEKVQVPRSDSSSSCPSTFEIKHPVHTYAIERQHERDDHDFLPTWKRWLARLAPFTTILSVGSYYLYFPYRIYCTRESSSRDDNQTYILAWFFIVAEAFVACKWQA